MKKNGKYVSRRRCLKWETRNSWSTTREWDLQWIEQEKRKDRQNKRQRQEKNNIIDEKTKTNREEEKKRRVPRIERRSETKKTESRDRIEWMRMQLQDRTDRSDVCKEEEEDGGRVIRQERRERYWDRTGSSLPFFFLVLLPHSSFEGYYSLIDLQIPCSCSVCLFIRLSNHSLFC